MVDTVTALRHRSFRVYFFGQLVSTSGTWMHLVAQGWLVWQLSGDEAVVGAISAAGFGATLVFSFVGGAAADRYDRRSIMLATQSCALALAAALGVRCVFGEPALWQVAAIAIGLGIVGAFDLPARHALVVELVPPDDLVKAVVLNQVLFNVARVVGPALAGLLIQRTSLEPGHIFLLNAASYLAILTALVRMPAGVRKTLAQRPGSDPVLERIRGRTGASQLVGPDEMTLSSGRLVIAERGAPATTPHPVEVVYLRPPVAPNRLFEGMRHVVRTPELRGLFLVVCGAGIFGWSIPVVLPSLASHLANDADLYGTMMSAIGAGAVVGALLLVVTTDRIPRQVLIPLGLALWSAAILACSIAPSAPLAVICLALGGLGMIQFTGASNAHVQATVPDELRGRVMAVWAMVYAIAEPIGAMQAGQLGRALGPRGELRVAGTAMATIGACWIVSHAFRRFRT